MYKFSEGQRVTFRVGTYLIGTGIIRGVATIEMPVIGRNYIVQILDSTIDKNIYPFSSCIVPEISLIAD